MCVIHERLNKKLFTDIGVLLSRVVLVKPATQVAFLCLTNGKISCTCSMT